MTEPSEEILAMARRIVERAVHWSPQTDRDLQSGKNDNTPEMKIAIAAIIETQERCAALAWKMAGKQMPAYAVGEAIRSGQQFRKDV